MIRSSNNALVHTAFSRKRTLRSPNRRRCGLISLSPTFYTLQYRITSRGTLVHGTHAHISTLRLVVQPQRRHRTSLSSTAGSRPHVYIMTPMDAACVSGRGPDCACALYLREVWCVVGHVENVRVKYPVSAGVLLRV